MKMRTEYTCPLEMTHDMIKGKWKSIIIWQLYKGSCSLSELKKAIHGISQKMLIQHLQELSRCGIIHKTRYEGYPLRSEYSLTERGMKLFDAISIMQGIGMDIMMEDNREDLLKAKGLL